MNNPFEIKVWAQMFFDDGSVSQGIRVTADIYNNSVLLEEIKQKLLNSVNRTEGFLLLWGAGEIYYVYSSISSCILQGELDSLAASPEIDCPPQHKIAEC